MISVQDMRELIAGLSERADRGDEDAAIQLNQVAANVSPDLLLRANEMPPILHFEVVPPRCEPEAVAPVQGETLGDILSGLLATDPASPSPWDTIEAAANAIAAHYALPLDDVWSVIIDLEIETLNETGAECFGRALERPLGFAILGLSVAIAILGEAAARAHPVLRLDYH